MRALAEKHARIILLSHFGRPKGPDPKESLAPLVPTIARHLGLPVAFAGDCIGPAAEEAAAALGDGEVLLLENLRFHKGEEKNDPEFAAALAKLGDLYVDDAFSAAHKSSCLDLRHPCAAARLCRPRNGGGAHRAR